MDFEDAFVRRDIEEPPPLLFAGDPNWEVEMRAWEERVANRWNRDPINMDIFVDQPLPMHERRRRRRPKGRSKHTSLTTFHENKRKNKNIRSNKRHSPSNKCRRKDKISRLNNNEPASNVTLEIIEEEDVEYTIERILGHRRNVTTGTYEVLISWEGYDATEDSWEPADVIRETAAETLAEYAQSHGLSTYPGWEWTTSLESDSLPMTTGIASKPTTVEGGSKQPIQTRMSTRRSKANTATNQTFVSSITKKLYHNLGFFFDDTTTSNPIESYIDGLPEKAEEEVNESNIPLESAIYDDPTKDFTCNTAKTLEIQELDKHIDEEDEWTIIKVLNHTTKRTTRRLPGRYSKNDTTKEKHTRLLVMFHDGDTQWVPLDAVLLQDPVPVINYVKKNNLMNKNKFKEVRRLI